jgi:RHS repeat-associated protein
MRLAKRKAALLALTLAALANAASASLTDVDGKPLRAARLQGAVVEAPRFALALEQSVALDLVLPELAPASLEDRLRLEDRASKPHLRAFDLGLEKQPQGPQRFELEIASGEWETGLVYARNRYYDPELGRFISVDPMGYVDGPNVYAFAGNDPANLSDPLGLCLGLNDEPCVETAKRIAESFVGFVQRVAPNKNPVAQELNARSARLVVAPITGTLSIGTGLGEALDVDQRRLRGERVSRDETQRAYLGAVGDVVAVGSLVAPALAPGRSALAPAAATREAAAARELVAVSQSARPSPGLRILNPEFTPDPKAVLQNIATAQNRALAADPSIARSVLSRGEYAAGQREVWLANMQYGNAVERLAAREIRDSELHSQLFKHLGGPNNPDFIGQPGSRAAGMNFDITTPAQVGTHMNRPGYGEGLNVLTYQRPASFRLFPELEP